MVLGARATKSLGLRVVIERSDDVPRVTHDADTMEKIWSVADQLVEWSVGHAHTALLDIEHRLDTRQAKVVDEQGLDPDIPRLGEPEHDDLADAHLHSHGDG